MAYVLYLAVILLSVLADQLSKLAVLRWLPAEGDSLTLLPGVFRFTHVNNTGAAFGSLQNARWVFMVISAVAIVLMAVYLVKWTPKSRLTAVSLCLIIGGGIGNMIDRIFRGYVVDFLDFCAFPGVWKYVFNVADACVCVGCFLILLFMLCVELPRERRAAREKKAAGQEKDGHD